MPIETVARYLAGANFTGADFTDANFTGAALMGANFTGAALMGANFTGADLAGANLAGADFTGANFTGADLAGAALADANFTDANFTDANFTDADLAGAALTGANFTGADFTGAVLRGANFTDANFTDANFTDANLSGVTGLLSAGDWLRSQIATGQLSIVDGELHAYKRIGKTDFLAPSSWKILPGAYLEEVVNPLPMCDCACGINVGTLDWCQKNYPGADLWEVAIELLDMASVVVPYHTDGKFRAGRVRLVRKY